MGYSLLKFRYGLLPMLVGLFLVCHCRGNEQNESISTIPKIEKGVLEWGRLSPNRITSLRQSVQTVPLSGEWEFYPNEFLEPTRVSIPADDLENSFQTSPNSQDPPQYFSIPSTWNHRLEMGGIGHGSFRLRFQLPKDQKYIIVIPSAATSSEFYCGTELVAKAGVVGKDRASSVPSLAEHLGVLSDDCIGSGVFTWHISNYFEAKGGPWEAPYISTADSYYQSLAIRYFLDFFFMGVTFVMFLYHLVHWFFRRRDLKSLYFSLICVTFFIRLVATGKYPEAFAPSVSMYEWMNKFEYLGYYILVVLFPAFCRQLFEPVFHKRVVQINAIVFGLLTLHVLLNDSLYFTPLLTYTNYFSLVIVLYTCWNLIRAWSQNLPGIRIMGFGFFIIAITFIVDLIVSQTQHGEFLAPFGFFVFLITQSVVLAQLYSEAYTTAEHLTDHLREEVELKTQDLEKANEQRTAFFQNISHEFRTPLTLILGILERSKQSDQPISEKAMNVLLNNGKRLFRLVNQLLDYQKISYGKFELKLDKEKIYPLVKECYSAFTETAKAKNIEYTLEAPDSSLVVNMDPVQLEKSCMNYLSNAFKFTPSNGKIKVQLNACNGEVVFSVEDSGTGIPMQNQGLLFRKFGYSEISLTREQEGTGLGLAITQEIIELHGGQCGFDSTEGVGSRFWFSIPLVAVSDSEDRLAERKNYSPSFLLRTEADFQRGFALANRPKEEPIFKKFGLHSILVVEDNQDLREFLAEVLSVKGYNVYQASDGLEGLEIAETHKPSLIVTDLMMPNLSGTEMIQNIRNNEQISTIPIILLTAKADPDTRKNVIFSGADLYLPKPFSEEELLFSVRNLLSLKEKERHFLVEIEKARRNQDSLLPPPLTKNQWFSAEFFLKSQDTIGGDLYDYKILGAPSEGRYQILLSDVSGHGLPASLISSTVKILFRKDKSGSPAQFFNELNEDLRGNIGENFVTGQSIVLDGGKRVLTYSTAGHPPILLIRDGAVIELQTRSRMVGFFQDTVYREMQFPIQAGDRIVLYTDGIVEASNEDKDLYGEEKFYKNLIATRKFPPREAIMEIVLDLVAYTNEKPLDDDITLILLDVL